MQSIRKIMVGGMSKRVLPGVLISIALGHGLRDIA